MERCDRIGFRFDLIVCPGYSLEQL